MTIDRKIVELGIKLMLNKDENKLLHFNFFSLAYVLVKFLEQVSQEFLVALIFL